MSQERYSQRRYSQETGGIRRKREVSDHLHPVVYRAIVGLVLVFVLSVWGLASDGYTEYLLVVVSGFIFVAVALPYALYWAKHRSPEVAKESPGPFDEWASSEFEAGSDRIKGADAAIEILLPIAAVALGMMTFVIVLHFAVHEVM